MRPPSPTCVHAPHVEVRFDEISGQPILLDRLGWPIATEDRLDYLADLIAAGVVPTVARRTESPNGLAWPAVEPKPWRQR